MKTKQLIFRWSLVTGGFIAIFWAIYYLFVGNVPIITSIKITQNWIIALPFGISRWWDILIGPIWSTIIILLLPSKKLQEYKDPIVGLTYSLAFGLGASLAFGLAFDPDVGLVFGLAFDLLFCLVFGLAFGLGASLVFSLAFGLGASLVFDLAFGPGVGLVFGLAFGLVVGLVALIKWGDSANFWTKIWDWMLVKN